MTTLSLEDSLALVRHIARQYGCDPDGMGAALDRDEGGRPVVVILGPMGGPYTPELGAELRAVCLRYSMVVSVTFDSLTFEAEGGDNGAA